MIALLIIIAVLLAVQGFFLIAITHNTNETCESLKRLEAATVDLLALMQSFRDRFENFYHDLEVWTKSRSK